MSRVRIQFDEDVVTEQLQAAKLTRCWFQPSRSCKTVRDFELQVRQHFQPATCGPLVVSLDGFTVPLDSAISILRDNDVITFSGSALAQPLPPSRQHPPATTASGHVPHLGQKGSRGQTLDKSSSGFEPHAACSGSGDDEDDQEEEEEEEEEDSQQEEGLEAAAHGCRRAHHSGTVDAGGGAAEGRAAKRTKLVQQQQQQSQPDDEHKEQGTEAPAKKASRSARRKAAKRRLARLGLMQRPATKRRKEVAKQAVDWQLELAGEASMHLLQGAGDQDQKAGAGVAAPPKLNNLNATPSNSSKKARAGTLNTSQQQPPASQWRKSESSSEEGSSQAGSSEEDTSVDSSEEESSEEETSSSSSEEERAGGSEDEGEENPEQQRRVASRRGGPANGHVAEDSDTESSSETDSSSNSEEESESVSESESEEESESELEPETQKAQEAPADGNQAGKHRDEHGKGRGALPGNRAGPPPSAAGMRKPLHEKPTVPSQEQCGQLPPLVEGAAEGMVLAYRLLEIGMDCCPTVSEFRFGKVTSTSGTGTSMEVTMSPWPNPSIHPLQPHLDALVAASQSRRFRGPPSDLEDFESLTFADLPFQTLYDDNGTLTIPTSSLCEVRLVSPFHSPAPSSQPLHSAQQAALPPSPSHPPHSTNHPTTTQKSNTSNKPPSQSDVHFTKHAPTPAGFSSAHHTPPAAPASSLQTKAPSLVAPSPVGPRPLPPPLPRTRTPLAARSLPAAIPRMHRPSSGPPSSSAPPLARLQSLPRATPPSPSPLPAVHSNGHTHTKPLPNPTASCPVAPHQNGQQPPPTRSTATSTAPATDEASGTGVSQATLGHTPPAATAAAANGTPPAAASSSHVQPIQVTPNGWGSLVQEMLEKKRAQLEGRPAPSKPATLQASPVSAPGAVKPRGGARRGAMGPLLSYLRSTGELQQ